MNFPVIPGCRAYHCRGPRPRHFLRCGANAVWRQHRRHRVDGRHGARRHRPCRLRAGSASPLSSLPAPSFSPLLKFCGALYLVWLGIRTFREAGNLRAGSRCDGRRRRAFYEGILVEALNPKTAAFFLAFIPQFIDPGRQRPALQFVMLGLISVALNTLADFVVVAVAIDSTQSIHAPATTPAAAATGFRAVHRRPRYFAGAGAPGREPGHNHQPAHNPVKDVDDQMRMPDISVRILMVFWIASSHPDRQ